MYNGLHCIHRRIDIKIEEQQEAIENGKSPFLDDSESMDCPYHISPQMLWVDKVKKRTLQEGALVFNESAREGIKYLQEAQLISDPATPADIARFLRFTPGLSKSQIGEYLGKNQEENKETLYEYVHTFDFRNTTLLTALRMFLDTFLLPGEAQQIDRIMEVVLFFSVECSPLHSTPTNSPSITTF